MIGRSRFLRWWFGHRLLWVLVAALPACLLFKPFLMEVRFYLLSIPRTGVVLDYGVTKEGIGASTLRGSWTDIVYSPWIEVEAEQSRAGACRSCRIEGQLGVFGEWVSDAESVVAQRLDATVRGRQIEYFELDRGYVDGLLCRKTKAVDLHVIALFVLSLSMSFWLAVWSYRTYSNRSKTTHGNIDEASS